MNYPPTSTSYSDDIWRLCWRRGAAWPFRYGLSRRRLPRFLAAQSSNILTVITAGRDRGNKWRDESFRSDQRLLLVVSSSINFLGYNVIAWGTKS
jgi:hypothetical protein